MQQSTFSVDQTYEPSPEFQMPYTTAAVPKHVGAPNWVLSSFYVGTMVFGAVSIITSAGQIYTRMKCVEFTDDAAATGTTIFEIIAWVTIVLSFVIILMSIIALAYRMGFSQQISTAYDTLFDKTKNKSSAMTGSTLSPETSDLMRGPPYTPYADLQDVV